MSSAAVATLVPLLHQLALVPRCLSPLQPLDTILIFLAMPGEPLVPMRVRGSESVASVKLRKQRFRGFVITKQRLVFGGHELSHNSSRVRDYGLTDGNVLHLVVRLSDLRAIAIGTANGRKYQFQAESSGSVMDQSPVHDDEELDDHQLVNGIGEDGDAVIHLFIQEPAKVRTQQGDQETVVTVVTPRQKQMLQTDDALKPITEPDSGTGALVEPIIVNRKVKLSPTVTSMISATIAGLENGILPAMSTQGSGGVYFMKDHSGQSNVSVFKPIDEEPMAENNPRGLPLSVDSEGLKRGTRVGEGAIREVAAYILDHPIDGCKSNNDTGFSGVPPSALVRCFHMGKGFKLGSLQMFVENSGSCEDMGTQVFPVNEVQKIAVLDIKVSQC